jgi:hypothetical protein
LERGHACDGAGRHRRPRQLAYEWRWHG